WLESVHQNSKSDHGRATQTTFRLRIRKLAGLNDELMLRLFFDDKQNLNPVVTAWNEIGEQLAASKPLGDGVGLPNSESLAISMSGVDYLDIDTPGDGTNVRGAFLTSLKTSDTKYALDFEPPAEVFDPFQNAPPAQPATDDAYLFGRVKAVLDNTAITLPPEAT